MLTLTCSYKSEAETTRVFETNEILLGRFNPDSSEETVPALSILNLYPDRQVSRPHARLFFKAGQWWVEDLGSTNGTVLNGRRLRREKAQLTPGDKLLVGDTRIQASFEENSQPVVEEDPTSVPLAATRPGQAHANLATQLQRLELLDKLLEQATGQQQVMEIALPMLKEFFPSSRQTIALLMEEELVACAYWPLDKSYLDFKLANAVLKSGEAVLENGVICAPLLDASEPFGVVFVDTVQANRKFSREEGQLLKRIAWTVGQGLKKHSPDTLDPLPSVFISYVREDRGWVNQLTEDLRRRRVKVWYDARMIVGAHWNDEIQAALEECEAFIVVLTPLSVASPWVKNELTRALELDKVVIPLLYQPCTYPTELEPVQRVNIGKDYEAGLEQIMARLSLLHLPPVPPALPAPTPALLPAPAFAPTEAYAAPDIVYNNLRPDLNGCIGRDHEIEEIRQRLQKERLITLTGPGGAGKTCLGIATARELASDFRNGVCFVSLAGLTTPAQVARKLARELDFSVNRDDRLMETIKAYLRDMHLLLVLDNFEQVLSAAPLVEGLLQAAPALKLLVTSRTPLAIQSEKELRLPPLALPDLKQLPWPQQLTQFSAVQLFVRRIHEVNPDFEFNEKNAAEIALICIRLNGLPLALELVAAQFPRFQNANTVLTHLADAQIGGLPKRQRTLENILDWSYNLLTEAEKQLFSGLSIFGAAWEEQAIRRICQLAGLQLDLNAVMTALLNYNLIKPQTSAAPTHHELRFGMPETVRGYALKRLQENPAEAEKLYSAFASGYLERAEQAALELAGAKPTEAYGWFDREYENLEVALEWLLADPSQTQRRETGLKMASALFRYWLNRGYLKEGRDWLEKALKEAGTGVLDQSLQANACVALGTLGSTQRNFSEAYGWLDKALEIQQILQDNAGLAYTHSIYGEAALEEGDYSTARAHLRQSLEKLQPLDDMQSIAFCLNYFSGLAAAENQNERAALLAGAAHILRETNHIPLPTAQRRNFQRRLQPALLALGPEKWRALFQAGSKMGLKEALAYALEPLDS